MSKTLTHKDILKIVTSILNRDPVRVDKCYKRSLRQDYNPFTLRGIFMRRLCSLITDCFGGCKCVSVNVGGNQTVCKIDIDENVPSDGGIYKEYCKSVIWSNGREISPDKEITISIGNGCTLSIDDIKEPTYLRTYDENGKETAYIDNKDIKESNNQILILYKILEHLTSKG